jgi:predicted ABC-type ATPase
VTFATAAPNVVLIAGPNGSGKTTAAPALLRDQVGITEFVNADTIAQGLSGFGAHNVAVEAGRIMLARLSELAERKADFAFETTLAARWFAVWLRDLKRSGYRAHLFFLWLPSAELAIARVADRVQRGGHHIPDDVVRRRYERGLRNFFALYRPVVDYWRVLDNSKSDGYELIAEESPESGLCVVNHSIWQSLQDAYA